jgi:hypothetical protein
MDRIPYEAFRAATNRLQAGSLGQIIASMRDSAKASVAGSPLYQKSLVDDELGRFSGVQWGLDPRPARGPKKSYAFQCQV